MHKNVSLLWSYVGFLFLFANLAENTERYYEIYSVILPIWTVHAAVKTPRKYHSFQNFNLLTSVIPLFEVQTTIYCNI
jgi:hypothetical protein